MHKRQLPEGWQDIIRIYKKGELEELSGDKKTPPPPGAFEEG